MKIVYNSLWLDHLLLVKQVKKWTQQEFVSKEEESTITAAYPIGFYRPNFWVALGLFVFTAVLLFAALGLFALIFLSAVSEAEPVMQFLTLVFGFGCLAIGEHYKKHKHYFHAGADNALVYMAIGLTLFVVGWIISDTWGYGLELPIYFLATVLFLACAYRYIDPFLGLAAFCAWFLTLFFFLGELRDIGKAVIPFVGLLNAIGIYLWVKLSEHQQKWQYHTTCLKALEIAALLAGYLSVNYFVVRELSEEMFGTYLEPGQEIPFAFLFYFFTVAIPPAYIFFGLWKKDRILLRIGLLLIALSIATIRMYHSMLPIETALTMGGLLLLATAYGLIRWLKTPQRGFTFEADKDSDHRILESLVVAQSFSKGAAPESETQFGGGDFGGGGASDGY